MGRRSDLQARIHPDTKQAAAIFPRVLIKTVPYKIHAILAGNSVQFVQRDQGGRRGDQPCLRPCLRAVQHRAPIHQALSSMDRRPGRAEGPHHQRGGRQILTLYINQRAALTRSRLADDL